ncbi:family 78 glycoside hydrolase catalytic domain [Pseudopedobacter beijingensis]|uniref:alpha-L-rhamnosidase n=1 Tax=Pseudopedobacter beijingensis TaxID=1207056 RepID=A0ABW4IE47_9SPHI
MRLKKIYTILFTYLFFNLPFFISEADAQIKPVHLRCEYKNTPVIDIAEPRLSWELVSNRNNQTQSAYQIIVASSVKLLTENGADIWNSGKVLSNSTNQIGFKGKKLLSGKVYYWKVRSWDKSGRASAWSKASTWETGFLKREDWIAKWIGYNLDSLNKNKTYHLPPAPYLRKEANVNKKIKTARLYVTSLGLYEFYINGKRIGEDFFQPGWTDYHKRVYYQVYDITKNIRQGKNAFASILSYGWYSGYLGYAMLVKSPQVRAFYGDTPKLKAQIEIEYAGGEKEYIVTDETWFANQGPLTESDILNGETYDARLELQGWDKPGYNQHGWKSAVVYPENENQALEIYPGNPVRIYKELKAKKIIPRPNGKYIVDFGQNFSGIIRLKVKGAEGDSIILRYGEMLHPDGKLMTENLRKARAADTYILKGDMKEEVWQPGFTYHGFQYVEISGLRKAPSEETVIGLVLSSSVPVTGDFETDNAMVNKLYKNIVWTQLSNYFDIPTDCPQRDERLGWTGDAHVYIKSAIYNNDISAFFTKWMTDLNDAQLSNGAYPSYAPMPMKDGVAMIRKTDSYSPGWMEAGIICTYELYKAYADTRLIEKYWSNMLRFMKFLETKSKGEYIFKERSFEDIHPKGGYGDWLSVGKQTSPDLLATMYYAYCAALMSEMARAIQKTEDKLFFDKVFENVKKKLYEHYTDKTGQFKVDSDIYGNGAGYSHYNPQKGFGGHTQTAYANAIYMRLLSREDTQKAGNYLKELILKNSGKLSTGFLGVKPLLPALSATDNGDMAYKLLLSTEYPSWGFEVVNGATTIWERWNSYTKEKGFENNAGMNSFNHYSFGAVNEWMFGNMAGIKNETPGYRTFIIKPEIPEQGINRVRANYRSINGNIVSGWKKIGRKLEMEAIIPVNTSAWIYIPSSSTDKISINGKQLKKSIYYANTETAGNKVKVKLGSGSYKIDCLLE